MPRYNSTANGLAALGRNGDTMLMHVNPQEVAGLSALLGSEPTVNPDTGMPEAFSWLNPILSTLFSAAEMGIGANIAEEVAGSEFAKGLSEYIDPETTGTIASALGGAATGAAANAATSAMLGQDVGYGAMFGGLGGAAMGGYGGMEKNALLGVPEPTAAEKTMDDLFYDVDTSPVQTVSPLATPAEAPGFFKTNFGSMAGLKNFAKEHGQVALMGGMLSSAGEAEAENARRQEQIDNIKKMGQLEDIRNQRSYEKYYRNLNSPYKFYNDGGAVVSREPGAFVGQAAEAGLPITMRIPDSYVDEFKKTGGIGNLLQMHGGMAQGGYINTKPFDPRQSHPQGMIDKATPYPAASPQRHEPANPDDAFLADGGFVDGEGDGMSDDVDATIDGVEPVKVADGEVIIPKDIVDMIGVDALDDMMKRVRMAAHGSEEQIKQDAAKKAFMQTVMG